MIQHHMISMEHNPLLPKSDVTLLQEYYHHIYLQKEHGEFIEQIQRFKRDFQKDFNGLDEICDELCEALLGYKTILPIGDLLEGVKSILDCLSPN